MNFVSIFFSLWGFSLFVNLNNYSGSYSNSETWILTGLVEKGSTRTLEIPAGEFIELSFHGENCITVNTRCRSNRGIFIGNTETPEVNMIRAMVKTEGCADDFFLEEVEELSKAVLVSKRKYNLLEVTTKKHILKFSPASPSADLNCIDPCGLDPAGGFCRGYFKKYYFDENEGRCKSFVWGGCGGTVPFESLEDCQRKCGR